MVEAKILISENAYKELLHCQEKYLELVKISGNGEKANNEAKGKESECQCHDQFGHGLDTGANCECSEGKNQNKLKQISSKPHSSQNINTFKTSSDFFSDLSKQYWYKRSPRKYRAVAEIIFYSSGILIGKDNSLHFEGSKIDDSNIYDIIRNEVNNGKSYVPGKIVVDRILEKTGLSFKRKMKPKRDTQQEKEHLPENWYELL